jgi:hypothetical protein
MILRQGYELAGFVWLQGFNDLVDGQTYPNGNYDEYSRLLAHFIRDVRNDLSAPKMPFIIGVLGVDGEKNVNFRKAMAAPAAMPEFKGNVVAVDTAPFWDRDIEAAEPKQGEYNEIVGTAHTLKADGTLDTQRKWDKFWKPIGKPLPAGAKLAFRHVDATETKDKLKNSPIGDSVTSHCLPEWRIGICLTSMTANGQQARRPLARAYGTTAESLWTTIPQYGERRIPAHAFHF